MTQQLDTADALWSRLIIALFDGEKKNVDNVMHETKTCVANTNAWLSALHIGQKAEWKREEESATHSRPDFSLNLTQCEVKSLLQFRVSSFELFQLAINVICIGIGKLFLAASM